MYGIVRMLYHYVNKRFIKGLLQLHFGIDSRFYFHVLKMLVLPLIINQQLTVLSTYALVINDYI